MNVNKEICDIKVFCYIAREILASDIECPIGIVCTIWHAIIQYRIKVKLEIYIILSSVKAGDFCHFSIVECFNIRVSWHGLNNACQISIIFACCILIGANLKISNVEQFPNFTENLPVSWPDETNQRGCIIPDDCNLAAANVSFSIKAFDVVVSAGEARSLEHIRQCHHMAA